jgi:hypothetical protein
MDQFNRELDELLAKYRSAVPDPDPSATFMPELWRKIEARQTLLLRVRKLTQVFVGAAAAVSLLFAMVEVVPRASRQDLSQQEMTHESYVDALAAAHPADNLAALGIAPRDSAEPRTK